ncbi:MAG: amino acid permease [Candidatus Eremiobacteraeota bacterium]|nr:amino acid permease [Candidatus Eremiobacteraeota bacterium]
MLRRLFLTMPLGRARAETQGVALRRVLGKQGLVGIGLGTMLGGIFTTIGAGANAAGPGVIASFVLSGLACFFVALCYSELACMVPVAGSAYTYAYATLGEIVAWVIGWDLILEYGISAAPVASSWSAYVQNLLGGVGLNLPAWAKIAHLTIANGRVDLAHTQVDVLAFAVVLAISILLSIGIKESSTTNNVMVWFQVAAIVVFVLGCIGAVRGQLFLPFAPLGTKGIVASAALVFFAYIGFDTVTVASEECKDPARDLPFGIIGSLLAGAILYLAIAFVTVGVVPWKSVDAGSGMLDAARHAGGNPILLAVVALGAIAGTTTVMLTSLLGQSRIFYVMARDGLLPPLVASIDPRTRTPVFSTMTVGIVVAFMAAIVPLDVLLALVNIGTLSAFSIVCIGVGVLRFTQPNAPRPFRSPLGIPVAVAGTILCTALALFGLGGETWLRFIVWFAVGVAIYAWYGYRHSTLATSKSA